MYKLTVWVSALTVLVSCADQLERRGTPHAPRADADAALVRASEAPFRLRRADLEFEIDGRPFPSPLVRATIGHRTTWLVVDTGANHHALAGWFVRGLGLSAVETHAGRDYLGRELALSRTGPLSITASGWGMVADEPLLVADVPDQLREMDLGGFLSPQFLAQDPGERVILDLARGELRVARKDDAQRSLIGRGVPITKGGALVCSDREMKNRSFVLPARIEGEPVQLLVDTGAARSSLRATSAAGAKLLQRANPWTERVYGAGGVFHARTLPDATIDVGAISMSTEIEIVPASPRPDCPFDGVLGMDVLRTCVLTLGEGHPDGRCEPQY
jgi:hypothetical protein